MKDNKRVVEKFPAKVVVELSIDGQKASIVFATEDGREFILRPNPFDMMMVEEITPDHD